MKSKLQKVQKKAISVVAVVVFFFSMGLTATAQTNSSNGTVPHITITPKPFAGAGSLATLLSYGMYGAWLVVFGMIIYAAVEAARGNHMGDTFKRVLVGVIVAAFLLTFGWAIISGVF